MAEDVDVWQARDPIPTLTTESSLTTQKFVATAGQTVFELTNFAYAVGEGSLLVFQNGNILDPLTEYTETDEDTFTLVTGATVGDIVLAVGFIGAIGFSDATVAAAAAAALSESNASSSEANAATSESNAQTAQGLAETAQAVAESAKTDAEAAQSLAETAKTGAETAQGLAETAKTQAEAAATQTGLDVAATAADVITCSAFATSDYALAAANSAIDAEDWASKAEDDLVDGTEYSAKHYAAKSSASASAASDSAAAAAASAATVLGMVLLDTPLEIIVDTSASSTAKTTFTENTYLGPNHAVAAILRVYNQSTTATAAISTQEVGICKTGVTMDDATEHLVSKTEGYTVGDTNTNVNDCIIPLDASHRFDYQIDRANVSLPVVIINLVGYYID